MEKNSIACVVLKKHTGEVKNQLSRFHLKVDQEQTATNSTNIIYYERGDYVTFVLKRFPTRYDLVKKNILIGEMRELQETHLGV